MIALENRVHSSWQNIVSTALRQLDLDYLAFLENNDGYFPDIDNFLNAFKTLPLDGTKYILFGQDPYPRRESAIGYAFIDGKVDTIFSPKGLSSTVNRATSLRNFIKTLLLCEGKLQNDFSQQAITGIDKTPYIDSIHTLRENFEKNGILLLNTALIFTSKEESKKHIKRWRRFTEAILEALQEREITLILFGKAAADLEKFPASRQFERIVLPHPYNISFIEHREAHQLFQPMHLLRK